MGVFNIIPDEKKAAGSQIIKRACTSHLGAARPDALHPGSVRSLNNSRIASAVPIRNHFLIITGVNQYSLRRCLSVQPKSVSGQLFDSKTNEPIDEVTVNLSPLQYPYSTGHPEFKGTLTVKGYRTELSGNTYILKLNKFSDDVTITMPQRIFRPSIRDFNVTQTLFNISFGGAVWCSHEWYKYLGDLLSPVNSYLLQGIRMPDLSDASPEQGHVPDQRYHVQKV